MSTTDTTAPATKPRGTTTKFTVPAIALRDLVAGILPAVSKDDITPVICAAEWIIEGNRLRLVATDRYRVHTSTLDLPGKPKAGRFLVPRRALLWIWKNANFYGRSHSNEHLPVVDVELTIRNSTDAGTVTFSVRQFAEDKVNVLRFTDDLVKGNFPPIYKLLETARTAEPHAGPIPSVKLEFLAAADKLAQHGEYAPKLKFTAGSGNKPGPLLVSFAGLGGAPYAEALIQPQMDLR